MNQLSDITTGELGTLFSGIAALITVLWAIGKALDRRWFRGVRMSMNATVLYYVRRKIEAAIEGVNPEHYYSLDIHFANGISLVAPMIPNKEILVAENIGISVIHHSCDCTTLSLATTGDAYLPPHWHSSTSEMIQVKQGTITHLETGRVYRTDEIWVIPAGEPHSAVFSSNCWAIVTHRPALPTAKERPINLDGIEKAFSNSK